MSLVCFSPVIIDVSPLFIEYFHSMGCGVPSENEFYLSKVPHFIQISGIVVFCRHAFFEPPRHLEETVECTSLPQVVIEERHQHQVNKGQENKVADAQTIHHPSCCLQR